MTSLSLNDSELFRQQAYIDGHWCEADNGKSFPVTNPATGEVLAHVPEMGTAGNASRHCRRKSGLAGMASEDG